MLSFTPKKGYILPFETITITINLLPNHKQLTDNSISLATIGNFVKTKLLIKLALIPQEIFTPENFNESWEEGIKLYGEIKKCIDLYGYDYDGEMESVSNSVSSVYSLTNSVKNSLDLNKSEGFSKSFYLNSSLPLSPSPSITQSPSHFPSPTPSKINNYHIDSPTSSPSFLLSSASTVPTPNHHMIAQKNKENFKDLLNSTPSALKTTSGTMITPKSTLLSSNNNKTVNDFYLDSLDNNHENLFKKAVDDEDTSIYSPFSPFNQSYDSVNMSSPDYNNFNNKISSPSKNVEKKESSPLKYRDTHRSVPTAASSPPRYFDKNRLNNANTSPLKLRDSFNSTSNSNTSSPSRSYLDINNGNTSPLRGTYKEFEDNLLKDFPLIKQMLKTDESFNSTSSNKSDKSTDSKNSSKLKVSKETTTYFNPNPIISLNKEEKKLPNNNINVTIKNESNFIQQKSHDSDDDNNKSFQSEWANNLLLGNSQKVKDERISHVLQSLNNLDHNQLGDLIKILQNDSNKIKQKSALFNPSLQNKSIFDSNYSLNSSLDLSITNLSEPIISTSSSHAESFQINSSNDALQTALWITKLFRENDDDSAIHSIVTAAQKLLHSNTSIHNKLKRSETKNEVVIEEKKKTKVSANSSLLKISSSNLNNPLNTNPSPYVTLKPNYSEEVCEIFIKGESEKDDEIIDLNDLAVKDIVENQSRIIHLKNLKVTKISVVSSQIETFTDSIASCFLANTDDEPKEENKQLEKENLELQNLHSIQFHKNLNSLVINNSLIKNLNNNFTSALFASNSNPLQYFPLNNLLHLDLMNNNITCISSFLYLPSLTSLNLSNNNLTKLDHIQDLLSLEVLKVSNNKLSTLPNSVGRLIPLSNSLKELDLRENPVCENARYIQDCLLTLPNLMILDGVILETLTESYQRAPSPSPNARNSSLTITSRGRIVGASSSGQSLTQSLKTKDLPSFPCQTPQAKTYSDPKSAQAELEIRIKRELKSRIVQSRRKSPSTPSNTQTQTPLKKKSPNSTALSTGKLKENTILKGNQTIDPNLSINSINRHIYSHTPQKYSKSTMSTAKLNFVSTLNEELDNFSGASANTYKELEELDAEIEAEEADLNYLTYQENYNYNPDENKKTHRYFSDSDNEIKNPGNGYGIASFDLSSDDERGRSKNKSNNLSSSKRSLSAPPTPNYTSNNSKLSNIIVNNNQKSPEVPPPSDSLLRPTKSFINKCKSYGTLRPQILVPNLENFDHDIYDKGYYSDGDNIREFRTPMSTLTSSSAFKTSPSNQSISALLTPTPTTRGLAAAKQSLAHFKEMQVDPRYSKFHPRYRVPSPNFGFSKSFLHKNKKNSTRSTSPIATKLSDSKLCSKQLAKINEKLNEKNKKFPANYFVEVERLRNAFTENPNKGTFPRAQRDLTSEYYNIDYEDYEALKRQGYFNQTIGTRQKDSYQDIYKRKDVENNNEVNINDSSSAKSSVVSKSKSVTSNKSTNSISNTTISPNGTIIMNTSKSRKSIPVQHISRQYKQTDSGDSIRALVNEDGLMLKNVFDTVPIQPQDEFSGFQKWHNDALKLVIDTDLDSIPTNSSPNTLTNYQQNYSTQTPIDPYFYNKQQDPTPDLSSSFSKKITDLTKENYWNPVREFDELLGSLDIKTPKGDLSTSTSKSFVLPNFEHQPVSRSTSLDYYEEETEKEKKFEQDFDEEKELYRQQWLVWKKELELEKSKNESMTKQDIQQESLVEEEQDDEMNEIPLRTLNVSANSLNTSLNSLKNITEITNPLDYSSFFDDNENIR